MFFFFLLTTSASKFHSFNHFIFISRYVVSVVCIGWEFSFSRFISYQRGIDFVVSHVDGRMLPKKEKKKNMCTVIVFYLICYLLVMVVTWYSYFVLPCPSSSVNYFELNPPLWVQVARVWVRVQWWVQKRVSVPVSNTTKCSFSYSLSHRNHFCHTSPTLRIRVRASKNGLDPAWLGLRHCIHWSPPEYTGLW